jgi:hypothetical protein
MADQYEKLLALLDHNGARYRVIDLAVVRLLPGPGEVLVDQDRVPVRDYGVWKQAHDRAGPPFSGETYPEQHRWLLGAAPPIVMHSASDLQSCTHQPVQVLP